MCDGRGGGNSEQRGQDLVFARLSIAVGDPAAGEVIRRHLDTHAIAHQNADAMFAHLS